MSKYGKVPRGLWHERWFRESAGNVRELALYLLTGPRSLSIPGVTLARPVVVADDLGWSQKRMRPALSALTEPREDRPEPWVEVDQEVGIMFVPTALLQDGIAVEMNRATSPNAAVSWIQDLGGIPAGPARDRIAAVMVQHGDNIGGEIGKKVAAARFLARGRQTARHGDTKSYSDQIRTYTDQRGAPVVELRRPESPDPDPEPARAPDVEISGVPVSGELAKDPGFVNVLSKALSRFGPLSADPMDPDLSRRRM